MNLVFKDPNEDFCEDQLSKIEFFKHSPIMPKEDYLAPYFDLSNLLDFIINLESKNEIILELSSFIDYLMESNELQISCPEFFFDFLCESQIHSKCIFILTNQIQLNDSNFLFNSILELINELLLLSYHSQNTILFDAFQKSGLFEVLTHCWNENSMKFNEIDLDDDILHSVLEIFNTLSLFSIESRDYIFELISASIGIDTILFHSNYRLQFCELIEIMSKYSLMNLKINENSFPYAFLDIYIHNQSIFLSKQTYHIFKTFNNLSEEDFNLLIDQISKEIFIDFIELYELYGNDDCLIYEILFFMHRTLKFDLIDFDSFYNEFVFKNNMPKSSFLSLIVLNDLIVFKKSSSILDTQKIINLETIDCDYPILSTLRNGLINLKFDIKRKIVNLICNSLLFASSSLITVIGVILLGNLTDLLYVLCDSISCDDFDLENDDVQFAKQILNIILIVFDNIEKNPSSEIDFLELFKEKFIENGGTEIFERLDFLEEINVLNQKYFT